MKGMKRSRVAARKNARPDTVTFQGAGAAAISDEARALKLRPIRGERRPARATQRRRAMRDAVSW